MSIFSDPDIYDGDPEGFHIYSWSPTPATDIAAGHPQAPSMTRVSGVGMSRCTWVDRFKGPGTLDWLIGALIKHRIDVWGIPEDHGVWRCP